jgi:polygalacturonase
MKIMRNWSLALCLFLPASVVFAQRLSQADVNRRLQGLPFDAPKITLPIIPDRSVSIKEYGAVPDGVTMNTKAFADAIEAVSSKGGGTVIVPAGHWLTGPIRLQSNVELRTERGALIVFSPRFDDYPVVTRPGSSTFRAHPPIWAVNAKNVAVTGDGTFDGNGQSWRPVKKEKLPEKDWKALVRSGGAVTDDGKIWFPSKEARDGDQYLKDLRKRNPKPTAAELAGAREFLRPIMVEFFGCEGVLVEGVTLTNAPAWTLGPVQCENVIIHRVTITNPWWAQNADGIDLNAVRNVLVSDCTVDTGDDAICIKPGAAPKDRRDRPSCENIIVTDCTVYHGHGGFVIGSESYGGARNLFGRNLTFIGTDVGLRFKSVPGRGGLIEKVYLEDIRMHRIADEAILFDMNYGGDLTIDVSDPTRIPEFRDFTLRRITVDGASHVLVTSGWEHTPVRNIVVDSLTARTTEGIKLTETDGVSLTRVAIAVTKGPVLEFTQARDVRISALQLLAPSELLVRVSGDRSSAIEIQRVGTVGATTNVEATNGATNSSVTIR